MVNRTYSINRYNITQRETQGHAKQISFHSRWLLFRYGSCVIQTLMQLCWNKLIYAHVRLVCDAIEWSSCVNILKPSWLAVQCPLCDGIYICGEDIKKMFRKKPSASIIISLRIKPNKSRGFMIEHLYAVMCSQTCIIKWRPYFYIYKTSGWHNLGIAPKSQSKWYDNLISISNMYSCAYYWRGRQNNSPPGWFNSLKSNANRCFRQNNINNLGSAHSIQCMHWVRVMAKVIMVKFVST